MTEQQVIIVPRDPTDLPRDRAHQIAAAQMEKVGKRLIRVISSTTAPDNIKMGAEVWLVRAEVEDA